MNRARLLLSLSIGLLVVTIVAVTVVSTTRPPQEARSNASADRSLPQWQPSTKGADTLDSLPTMPTPTWTDTAESLFGQGFSGLSVEDTTDRIAVVSAQAGRGSGARSHVAQLDAVTGERQWVSSQNFGQYVTCVVLLDATVACRDQFGSDEPGGTATNYVHVLDGRTGKEIRSVEIGGGLVSFIRLGSFLLVRQSPSTDDPSRDITQPEFIQVYDSALNLRWSAQISSYATYSSSESTGIVGAVSSQRVEAFSVATGRVLAAVPTERGDGRIVLTQDGFAISSGSGPDSRVSTFDRNGAPLVTTNFWQLPVLAADCDSLLVMQYGSGEGQTYARMDPATGAIVWRTTSRDPVSCVGDAVIVPGADDAAPSTFLNLTDGTRRGSGALPVGRYRSDGTRLLVDPDHRADPDPDVDQLMAYDWYKPAAPVWQLDYRGQLRFAGRYLFGYDVDDTAVSLMASR